MKAMAIARTGLDVEWQRLEVIADNLANVDTTRTANGQPFQAKRLISGPRDDFSAYFDGRQRADTGSGVTVYGVEPINASPRRVYDPSHPHADADGYVTYPAIDHAAEMTLMIATSRAYEADLVAMNLARQMYAKALELGQQG